MRRIDWYLLLHFALVCFLWSSKASKFGREEGNLHPGRFLATNINASTVASQKQRKKAYKQNYAPYTEEENNVRKTSQSWGDFSNANPLAARSKPYIRSSVAKSLQQCIAPNAAPACKEVKSVNFSLCALILVSKRTYVLRDDLIQSLGDDFIIAWKNRRVNGLCEDTAVSKVMMHHQSNLWSAISWKVFCCHYRLIVTIHPASLGFASLIMLW